VAIGSNDDCATRGTDAWIDDREMNCIDGKIAPAGAEREGSG